MPKILVIDDKEDHLIRMSTLLRSLIPGCRVMTARSGKEGVEKAEAEWPDTILLDVIIQGIDGLETCRALKENSLTGHIPIILTTNMNTDDESRARGLECGADGFLSKPVEENLFLAQVKTALRIKQAEDVLRRHHEVLEKQPVPRFDDQGRLVAYDGLIQNITERKTAEEEVYKLNAELEQRVHERTAQLEAVNKELEGFSYSISHDLRAPLRHLTGFVNLLNKQVGKALDEKSRHYLQVISDSALKMDTLINDILSFSRMGRLEMMQSRVDMEKILKEAITETEPEWKDREVAWSAGPLPMVFGDPTMLKTVMTNLISNALKFTGRIKKAAIEIGLQNGQSDEDVFFVRDNGAGFDMAYYHKLFGLFQRLHGENEFEGTGVGLANVQRIIARHGGRTWAEGAVGEGATFYFSLPRRP